MVDRILSLLQYLGMTPSRFADEIGVQRSAMSHLVSGRNNPSLEFVNKILKRFPEISTDWLIAGTGSMTREGQPVPEVTAPPLFPELDIDQSVDEEQAIPKQPKVRKSVGEKGIERIIIVYNDRTFRELYPEKD